MCRDRGAAGTSSGRNACGPSSNSAISQRPSPSPGPSGIPGPCRRRRCLPGTSGQRLQQGPRFGRIVRQAVELPRERIQVIKAQITQRTAEPVQRPQVQVGNLREAEQMHVRQRPGMRACSGGSAITSSAVLRQRPANPIQGAIQATAQAVGFVQDAAEQRAVPALHVQVAGAGSGYASMPRRHASRMRSWR